MPTIGPFLQCRLLGGRIEKDPFPDQEELVSAIYPEGGVQGRPLLIEAVNQTARYEAAANVGQARDPLS